MMRLAPCRSTSRIEISCPLGFIIMSELINRFFLSRKLYIAHRTVNYAIVASVHRTSRFYTVFFYCRSCGMLQGNDNARINKVKGDSVYQRVGKSASADFKIGGFILTIVLCFKHNCQNDLLIRNVGKRNDGEFQNAVSGIFVIDVKERRREALFSRDIGQISRIKIQNEIACTKFGVLFEFDSGRYLTGFSVIRRAYAHARCIFGIAFIKCNTCFRGIPATRIEIQLFVVKIGNDELYIRAFGYILQGLKFYGNEIILIIVFRTNKGHSHSSVKICVDVGKLAIKQTAFRYRNNRKQLTIVLNRKRT